jgi:hypothetical protein
VVSSLENRAFVHGPIFHLYQVFLPSVQIETFVLVGATAWYKYSLTRTRRGLLQPTRYKCLTFVLVVAPPGTMWGWHICTGWGYASVQMWRHLYWATQPPDTSLPPCAPQFFKSSPPNYLLFYCLSSSSSFSIVLISFSILLSSHISLDPPCRASGGADRPAQFGDSVNLR